MAARCSCGAVNGWACLAVTVKFYLLNRFRGYRSGLSSAAMRCSVKVATTTLIPSIITVVIAAGVAYADPPTPQVGGSCDGPYDYENTQTFTETGEVLICRSGLWQHVDSIQRPVEYWKTYGPPATLHGDDVNRGEGWIGLYNRATDNICTEEQQASTGEPPEVVTGQPPFFGFGLMGNLDVLKLTGDCNWGKAPPGGSPG